jgi:hypothetical protein
LENNRYRRLLKLMNNELRESKVDSLPWQCLETVIKP